MSASEPNLVAVHESCGRTCSEEQAASGISPCTASTPRARAGVAVRAPRRYSRRRCGAGMLPRTPPHAHVCCLGLAALF